jgi:hypothetical protein
MRRTLDARAAYAVVPALSFCLLAPATTGCDRKAEPTPAANAAPFTSAVPFKPARKDRAGAPTTASSAGVLPLASREPDMGLDPADPSRDYVARYLKASQRYGAQSGCVVVKPSTFSDKTSAVETRNDASGKCGKPDALRDRFLVSIATDRMSLDESLHQPKLKSWPDGSDPDGPAAKLIDLQDLRGWKASLRDVFRSLQLAPLRVQLYGRGTYPVISIAGWHGPVLRTMTPDQLQAPAKAFCNANDGQPIGIIAGLDRATLLRITCPGTAHFESL